MNKDIPAQFILGSTARHLGYQKLFSILCSLKSPPIRSEMDDIINVIVSSGLIDDYLASRGYINQIPEGYALVPIDTIHKTKILINFHVKRGACIDIDDKLYTADDIYGELNRIWIKAAQSDGKGE